MRHSPPALLLLLFIALSLSHVIQPDASIDPLSTVYELMEECDEKTEDFLSQLGEKTRQLLARRKGKVDSGDRKADATLLEDERFLGEDSIQLSRNQGFALMRSLDEPVETSRRDADPKNPFENDDSMDRYPTGDRHREKSMEHVPIPITPTLVLHRGRCKGPNCPLGSHEISTSHDRSPCPARQNDPCAPRPICVMNCEDKYRPPPLPQQQPVLLPPPAVWSEWSPCSVSCGEGVRTRQCLGGNDCLGPDSMRCHNACPTWMEWSTWSICTVSCGQGERRRTRMCTILGGCQGPSQEVDRCSPGPCPEWSTWGNWEECSVSCGFGAQRRYRRCENGLACVGLPVEERPCPGLAPCPYLGPWSDWTRCTVSCGVGETMRNRQCLGGTSCSGSTEERLLCNSQPCPEWQTWTTWSACDGCADPPTSRIRNRVCLYENRSFAGACPGPGQDQSPCPASDCPKWSDWTDWSECDQPCGQGSQKRHRSCSIAGQKSSACRGPAEELRFCQVTVCPYWSEWSEWGGCSTTCGIGACSRNRKCIRDELLDIPNLAELEAAVAAVTVPDDSREVRQAEHSVAAARQHLLSRSKRILRQEDAMNPSKNLRGQITTVAEFEAVIKRRARHAPFPRLRSSEEKPYPEAASSCDGPSVEHKPCDPGPCCGWHEWSEWSACDGCNVNSITMRRRVCSAVAGLNALHGHFGHGTDSQRPLTAISYQSDPFRLGTLHPSNSRIHQMESSRNISHLPLYPLGDVSGLSPIVPINDPRAHRGKRRVSIYTPNSRCSCDGPSEETRMCSSGCSQMDERCEWSAWGDWCGCIACRPGRDVRRRFCERPSRRVGYAILRPEPDCRCPGRETEERECPMCPTGQIMTTPASLENSMDDKYPSADAAIEVLPHWQENRESREWADRSEKNWQEYSARTRDLPLPSTEPTHTRVQVCRWSRWSNWSSCGANRLKQRSRFCIGADVPLSDCQCMGLSVEETSCQPGGERLKPRETVDSKTLEQTRKLGSLEAGTSQGARKDIYHRENKSEERKEPEKADLGTGREKGVRGITSPEKKSVEKEDLENGNGERSDEERGKSDEDGDNTSKKPSNFARIKPGSATATTTAPRLTPMPIASMSFNITSDASGPREWPSFEVSQSEKSRLRGESETITTMCSWTMWSLWSDCTVTCGVGERIRRKRCPCGTKNCGGGITLESERCEKTACSDDEEVQSVRTRLFPIFKKTPS